MVSGEFVRLIPEPLTFFFFATNAKKFYNEVSYLFLLLIERLCKKSRLHFTAPYFGRQCVYGNG